MFFLYFQFFRVPLYRFHFVAWVQVHQKKSIFQDSTIFILFKIKKVRSENWLSCLFLRFQITFPLLSHCSLFTQKNKCHFSRINFSLSLDSTLSWYFHFSVPFFCTQENKESNYKKTSEEVKNVLWILNFFSPQKCCAVAPSNRCWLMLNGE